MASDIREFVESCLTCQLETTNHTLQKQRLQFLAILEAKWKEVIGKLTCNGFTSHWRYQGLNYGSGGLCYQDGAFDPLQEDHHNRRSCKIILVARGGIAQSPSSYPHQLGAQSIGIWW